MVRLGTVALDGTKLTANAAERANRTLAKVEEEVAEILRQAAEADRRDELAHGDARGDELPAELASKASRLARLRVEGAQAVVTEQQIVVAAEPTQQANDLNQLQPMLDATTATLAAAGITERPGTLLADCGYWTIANLTELPDAPELLSPPAKHGRQGKPARTAGRRSPRVTGCAPP